MSILWHFFLQFFVGAKPQVRCHVKKISVINIEMRIYDAHNRQHLEFLVLFTLRGDSYEIWHGRGGLRSAASCQIYPL